MARHRQLPGYRPVGSHHSHAPTILHDLSSGMVEARTASVTNQVSLLPPSPELPRDDRADQLGFLLLVSPHTCLTVAVVGVRSRTFLVSLQRDAARSLAPRCKRRPRLPGC